MRHFISALLVLSVLFFPSSSPAQPHDSSSIQGGISQTGPPFVVGVIVHDKKGRAVGGLTVTDFVVIADGKPQSVVDFRGLGSAESSSTAVVIDRSGSRRDAFLNAEFTPLKIFVGSDVDSSHGAFLLAFNDHPFPVGGYSTTSAKFDQELQRVASTAPNGMTARNDAIELASRDLSNAQGYRIMLVVGEGDDNHSKSTPEEAIDSALKARAAVYFIRLLTDPANLNPERAWEDFATFPKKIAAETGGEVLSVEKKADLENAFTAFRIDVENLYLLGFAPSQLRQKGFHSLKIRTKQKDLQVIAPTKFYLQNQERSVTANPEK